MSMSTPQEQPQASAAGGQQPPPEQVAQALEAAKAARRFQDAADALKRQASLARDPAEREKLWRAAYIKEKEAHGESRKARFMASGWGQGAGLAVGISSAVGMGLGNLVGALLSGVVAVPGVLVGSGVGAIHGPWYKFKDALSGGGGNNRENEKIKAEVGSESESGEESSEDVQAHLAIVEAARQLDEEQGKKEAPKQEEGNGSRGQGRVEDDDASRETPEPTKKKDKSPQSGDKVSKQMPAPVGKEGTQGQQVAPDATKDSAPTTRDAGRGQESKLQESMATPDAYVQ